MATGLAGPMPGLVVVCRVFAFFAEKHMFVSLARMLPAVFARSSSPSGSGQLLFVLIRAVTVGVCCMYCHY